MTAVRPIAKSVPDPDPQDIVFEGSFEEVNRLFLENGWSDGLPIVPPWEIEKPKEAQDGLLACMRCGAVGDHTGTCHHCGHDHFTQAREEARFADDEK